MDTTPGSLLERLRHPGQPEAWRKFVQLYTPLLFHWARHLGLREQDAADLVQDVFLVLVRKLPDFIYDRRQSFRGWLRTVTLNKWRESARRRGLPMEGGSHRLGEVAGREGPDAFWEAEYKRHLVGRALELVQTDFQPATWKACWEQVVAGRPAAEVAAELGISEGAAYVAKCRVLRRLRQELDGLMD